MAKPKRRYVCDEDRALEHRQHEELSINLIELAVKQRLALPPTLVEELRNGD